MTQDTSNKIGIGNLHHAKANKAPRTANGSHTAKSDILKIAKSRQKKQDQKANGNPKKEGQLAVDIVQTEDQMIVVCPIAGVEKSDIKVALQDDVLTIRGERRPVKETAEKTPLVRELFWGTFSRSIVLPDHIDRKNISARVHEHMLIIKIPKTEDFKTRIIHINED
jgi:HSP20 family protein